MSVSTSDKPAVSQPDKQPTSGPRPFARVGANLKWLLINVGALWVLLFLVILFSSIPQTSATFPHIDVGKSVLIEVSIGGLVALGLLVPLAAGVFDLSVGYMVAAGSVAYTYVGVHTHLPPIMGLLAVVAVACVVAAANTLGTVYLGIHSFIATLAVGSLLVAALGMVTGNQDILGVPDRYVNLFGASMWGLTRGVYAVLLIAVLIWWLLSISGHGPRIHATGFNPDAARLAGVAVSRYIGIGFLVSAICAGLAGAILVGSINSGSPTIGPSYLLSGFAAAFLGSTQIRRGRFNVWGTVLAVVTLGVGVKGLALAGASFWASDLFNGVALLLAVGLSAKVGVGVEEPAATTTGEATTTAPEARVG
jgi:ribose transport system permease protein